MTDEHDAATTASKAPATLGDIMDGLAAHAEDAPASAAPSGPTTVGAILDALGDRSLGPLLFVPSLIAMMPVIGAVPGISWTMAALILLISGQYLFHSRAVWLPEAVRRIPVSRRMLAAGVKVVRPGVRVLERVVRPRLGLFVNGLFSHLVALACVLLALVMFAVSFVPGGVVVPAFGVAVFAVGLTARDGLVVLIGMALAAGAVGFAVWALG